MVPWGEALPGHENSVDAPTDLFLFYAVGDGVQHRGKQQVDVGQEDANKTGSMFAKTVDHGQANHGDVQDMGQAVLQSLEMLPLGCDAHSCLTGHNI